MVLEEKNLSENPIEDILPTVEKKDGEITMCDILQGLLDKGRQNVKALLDGGSMPPCSNHGYAEFFRF